MRTTHGATHRPIHNDGRRSHSRWVDPHVGYVQAHPRSDPRAGYTHTVTAHAAFSSGCGPYLARMIHGARARPIQKDGTLQRFLLDGLGPAPTVGQPWGDPPGASTCNDHAAFASGCGPYLVRMIHGARARPIQKDGTLQRFLLGGSTWACTNRASGSAVGRPARRFHMQ